MYESLDVFEIWPDSTMEYAALERMKKSHRLIMGETMPSHFLRNFYWILFIFAGMMACIRA